MHRTTVLLAAALLAACESSREVVVRVAIPGLDSVEAPVPGTVVMALPYDRDSLREVLAARAGMERPVAAEAELDSLFGLFREPFTEFLAASSRVSELEDSLATLGGTAPPELRSRLETAQRERDAARERLDEVRTATSGRVDSLRAQVQRWESAAFADWSTEVTQLGRGRREPRADTTGARGIARLTLPDGGWWLHATAHDPLDPNSRWYWNVPVPATGDTIVLDAAAGERRARY